jgi:hypothetical protein
VTPGVLHRGVGVVSRSPSLEKTPRRHADGLKAGRINLARSTDRRRHLVITGKFSPPPAAKSQQQHDDQHRGGGPDGQQGMAGP